MIRARPPDDAPRHPDLSISSQHAACRNHGAMPSRCSACHVRFEEPANWCPDEMLPVELSRYPDMTAWMHETSGWGNSTVS